MTSAPCVGHARLPTRGRSRPLPALHLRDGSHSGTIHPAPEFVPRRCYPALSGIVGPGDRDPACSRLRGAGDRPPAGPVGVDDLTRTAPQRCDPWRIPEPSVHDRAVACRSAGQASKEGKARRQRRAAALCAGPARRDGHPSRRRRGARSAGGLDRSSPWTAEGSALGEVVEPEQIVRRIQLDFPDDESMRISHEAIYQAASSSPACTPAGRFDIRKWPGRPVAATRHLQQRRATRLRFMPTRCILGLRAASTHRSQQ
jgi:hypothetical protein